MLDARVVVHSVNLSSSGTEAQVKVSLVCTAQDSQYYLERLSQKRTVVVRCSSAHRRMRQGIVCWHSKSLSQQETTA